MSSHVRVAGGVLLVGLLAITGYFFWQRASLDVTQVSTSDAAGTKARLRIAVDSWVGYYPLCSQLMKRQMREAGYALECIDDKADYQARMKALAAGEIEFAVATVDSYVANGAVQNYPGVILAVIDESKGGDALIVRKDKLAKLDDLKKKPFTIALTPNSPSEYLAKSLAVHFDIDSLRKRKEWRVDTQGSAEALALLQRNKVDAAILWEPDVSRALKDPALQRLIGTEQTQRLIVDVLLANREFAADKGQHVQVLLQQYFRVLKQYRDEPALLISELDDSTDLGEDAIQTMIQGVAWATLTENAELWLAHGAQVASKEALISTIESVVTVLTEYGDFNRSPLPDADPYRLLNSSFIHELYASAQAGTFSGSSAASSSVVNAYPALSEEQWRRLNEVGTLKVRPIAFASGSDTLTLDDKERLDEIADNLSHYPAFRIEIRGHSGSRGDADANRLLSQDRADAVQRYLEITHNFPPTRMRALGFGSDKPLPKQPDETERAYNYRLQRVELVLLGQGY